MKPMMRRTNPLWVKLSGLIITTVLVQIAS